MLVDRRRTLHPKIKSEKEARSKSHMGDPTSIGHWRLGQRKEGLVASGKPRQGVGGPAR